MYLYGNRDEVFVKWIYSTQFAYSNVDKGHSGTFALNDVLETKTYIDFVTTLTRLYTLLLT
jgi:hypothetical protein